MKMSVAEAVDVNAKTRRTRPIIPGSWARYAIDTVSRKPKRIPDVALKIRASARISPMRTSCSSMRNRAPSGELPFDVLSIVVLSKISFMS